MGVSFIVVIVLNLLALAILGVYVYRLDARVADILRDAIAKEIRLQDDRIEKRVSRREGHVSDSNETSEDGMFQGAAGRPYRRR